MCQTDVTPFNLEIRCCSENVSLPLRIEILPMAWHSICLSLDLSSGSWHGFVNGEKILLSETEDPIILKSVVEGGGSLFMGQHQNVLGKGFSKAQSLRATLMDFLMAYEIMDTSYMEGYTTCNGTEDVMPKTFLNFYNILAYDSQKVAHKKNFTAPSTLQISMDMLLIKEFDIAHFTFTTEAIIKLTWIDERLTYLNLQEASWKTKKISNEIWTPPIEFLGHGGTSCDTKDENNITKIIREKEGYNDNTRVPQDLLYDGDANAVELTRRVTIKSNCLFGLFAFPFDEQNCSLDALGSIHVNLIFSNLSTYFLTSTYIPTFILLIIGYMTFFFAIDDFTDRFMAALTALLVEAAFFTQTSQSVPQTAYIKLVDIWFVFCIAFLFLIMVVIVIIDVLKVLEEEPQEILHEKIFNVRLAAVFPKDLYGGGEGEEETAKNKKHFITSIRLNTFSKIFFPCSSVLFVVVYYAYAATYKEH
ncbi:gamma-aminobutyric acid receptor subunit alpha-5-like [Macrobrachium nipponense]|uniref:gamma-aminobutyric acid receptor subunit alpha-5-like n=1 Tax=Macrobrachium nipponense TaxID=159736 RepID=UPI0030C89F27